MSDVTETLQDLMERRLLELGKRRGRGEQISLREAYQRMLDTMGDYQVPTYEVFRRIRNGHTKITDPTALALATMLEVDVDQVYAAARIRPRLGRFDLPTRADRLNAEQRKVVLSVVDAILAAGEPAAAPGAGHLSIVAGAGTGKSEAISERIAAALGSEIEKLGAKVPEKLVRVAVTSAMDETKHPELYEDLAARETTI